MSSFTFIHAADLHLDAAFKGVAATAPHIANALQKATFEALSRLTKLACTLRPSFVVLAGDIYNQEDHSLKARFALLDACKQMQQAGVRVFIVHGNHDPLRQSERTFQYPENVTVFGTEGVEQVRVHNDQGELVSIVHGISHGKDNERRNLARQFSRAAEDVFQVAVLHCTVDSVAASEQYAPASVADFAKSEIDYWALGHIHEQQIISTEPFAAYSGNIQGLHINEQGERGCLVVNVADNQVQATHHTLGPIQWKIERLDIASMEYIDALEEAVEESLESLVQSLPDGSDGIIVRLILEGRTALDAELRKNGATKELLERLREDLIHKTPFLWLKDIELACKPDVDLDAMRTRPDLLGEALTIAGQLTRGGEQNVTELEEAISELYGSRTTRRHLNVLTEEELLQLATEAQYLCLDLLEVE